jgi:hypothetical protein
MLSRQIIWSAPLPHQFLLVAPEARNRFEQFTCPRIFIDHLWTFREAESITIIWQLGQDTKFG